MKYGEAELSAKNVEAVSKMCDGSIKAKGLWQVGVLTTPAGQATNAW
jgi:hypothetical protein